MKVAANPVDLRLLYRPEFHELGTLLPYRLRPVHEFRVRKNTEGVECGILQVLSGQKRSIPLRRRTGGLVMQSEESGFDLFQLTKHTFDSLYEFTSEESQEKFEQGEWAKCQYKPWEAIRLEVPMDLILQGTEAINSLLAQPGDVVCRVPSNPARYEHYSEREANSDKFEQVRV